MGRGKLKMEMIQKEKSRIITLKKRKEGLIKKLHQLTTLCDVPACMIFHDPTTNSTSVWPEEDPGQVRRLIDAYKAKKSDPTSGGVREYMLSNFFDDRQRQAEEELEKLRKENVEGMFPTWDDRLDLMDEAQLRELAAAARGKAEAVRSRIEFLKQAEADAMVVIENNAMRFNYCDFDQDVKSAEAMMMDSILMPPPPPRQPLLMPAVDAATADNGASVDVNENGDFTRYLCH
ncbi:agamous-like MADS-box protein AGL11 [Salvia hispanica]|uniref:agamous-like MADS-box protein AGL11 n=1 Tax=Salvia hispanica TaxID=49212 RepID=UPI002009DAD7|nr:agamous-like MADS-box protein AGL11 [Salvia hispanica]